jgi:hypothetical protein
MFLNSAVCLLLERGQSLLLLRSLGQCKQLRRIRLLRYSRSKKRERFRPAVLCMCANDEQFGLSDDLQKRRQTEPHFRRLLSSGIRQKWFEPVVVAIRLARLRHFYEYASRVISSHAEDALFKDDVQPTHRLCCAHAYQQSGARLCRSVGKNGNAKPETISHNMFVIFSCLCVERRRRTSNTCPKVTICSLF